MPNTPLPPEESRAPNEEADAERITGWASCGGPWLDAVRTTIVAGEIPESRCITGPTVADECLVTVIVDPGNPRDVLAPPAGVDARVDAAPSLTAGVAAAAAGAGAVAAAEGCSTACDFWAMVCDPTTGPGPEATIL